MSLLKKDKPDIRHFCTYPSRGGAGIAAARLVSGLRDVGEEATLWGVTKPDGSPPWMHAIRYGERIDERLWRRFRKFQVDRIHHRVHEVASASRMPYFSDLSPHGWAMAQVASDADLVHLHWVSDFMDYPRFLSQTTTRIPIVWTLHDMTTFTGGCIYAGECDAYQDVCGRCPVLDSSDPNDDSYHSLKRKKQALNRFKGKMTIVTPSRWLQVRAIKSSLFGKLKCEVVPNPLDLSLYHPGSRRESRERHGVSPDTPVVLFVAASLGFPIKGLDILREAVGLLGSNLDNAQIWCVGDRGTAEIPVGWRIFDSPSNEDEMISLYSAADLLVVPSRVENYPNVICEALACGVPVLGSDVGGIPELVIEHRTGALFKHEDPMDLSRRMKELLADIMNSRDMWSQRCREYAEETIDINLILNRYQEIYSTLLTNHN